MIDVLYTIEHIQADVNPLVLQYDSVHFNSLVIRTIIGRIPTQKVHCIRIIQSECVLDEVLDLINVDWTLSIHESINVIL